MVSAISITGGFCVLLLALWVPLRTAYAAEPALIDPRTLTFKPIEYVPPEPDRMVLENGMVIYLLEDHELPLITIGALMRTGGWLDPPDKVGLAALTGNVMQSGGGGGLSAAEVDDELAQFAGRMTIAIGRQSGSASLEVMRRTFSKHCVFSLAYYGHPHSILLVDLAKLQAMERIRRREDDPSPLPVVNSPSCCTVPAIPPHEKVRSNQWDEFVGKISAPFTKIRSIPTESFSVLPAIS